MLSSFRHDKYFTLPAIGVAASIGSVVYISYRYIYRSFFVSHLPPKASRWGFEYMILHLNGKHISEFYEEFKAREIKLFYYFMPVIFNPIFVCGDIALAKLLLEGDTNTGTLAAPKSSGYKTFNIITGGVESLLTKAIDDKSWICARKGVTPSFSTQNLTKSVSTKSECITTLLECLHEAAKINKDIDISEIMTYFTLDFLTSNMFDVSYNTLNTNYITSPPSSSSSSSPLTTGQQFLKEIKVALKELSKRFINPFRTYLYWQKDVIKGKDATVFIKQFAMNVLETYRQKMSTEDIQKDPSIMGHLMRTEYASDNELCADIIIFLFAGHDTTGYTLAWVILEICRHPYVLKTIQNELDRLYPNPSTPIEHRDLYKLEYLLCVIRETMRLRPVVPSASFRMAAKDMNHNGYIIPKNSRIHISSYAIQRLYVEDGDVFKPERWMKGSSQYQLLHDTNLSFSLGKRSCVGQNMAMLELKLVLATVFRLFEFERSDPTAPMSFTVFATAKPDYPFVRVKKRSFI
mmetsp:Transcript_23540/g.23741  ORF Transcript_23540/g.23741 Transcript_23540/m.23741 type:complete len:520 (+) Transcript_23540:145-1704(+)